MQHDFILLDRSQSMSEQGKWPEALAGINTYVAKLAADNVDTGVTLATFDKPAGSMAFEVIRDRITPATWKPVSDADATPRGWTPLSDAVGRIVSLANGGHGGANYTKVAIIIVTDGQENSSQELSVPQAKKLLDECRAKGWQVIFLGADFANEQQAAGYGNAAQATVQSSVANLRSTFAASAAKRADWSIGAAATMEFTDEEKVALKQ